MSLLNRCPCGEPGMRSCAACGRYVCSAHSVACLETDADGNFRPVCMPRCTAIWWKRQPFYNAPRAEVVQP